MVLFFFIIGRSKPSDHKEKYLLQEELFQSLFASQVIVSGDFFFAAAQKRTLHKEEGDESDFSMDAAFVLVCVVAVIDFVVVAVIAVQLAYVFCVTTVGSFETARCTDACASELSDHSTFTERRGISA